MVAPSLDDAPKDRGIIDWFEREALPQEHAGQGSPNHHGLRRADKVIRLVSGAVITMAASLVVVVRSGG